MKLVICESIPAFNKGEEAIMRGMIGLIRQTDGVEIIYSTEYYNEDAEAYGGLIDRYHKERLPDSAISKIIKHLVKALKIYIFAIPHVVLPSGWARKIIPDDALDYIEASVYFIGHDNLYINKERVLSDLLLVLFARIKGIKVYSIGSSIGPFSGSPAMISMCRFVLNRFTGIMLREQSSKSYLEKLDVSVPKIEVEGDLAFLMPPLVNTDNRHVIEEIQRVQKEGKKIIAVTISHSTTRKIFNETISLNEKVDHLIDLLATVFDRLHSKRDVFFVFISHVSAQRVEGDSQDDNVLVQKIIKRVKSEVEYIEIETRLRAQQLKAIISTADVLISSRTHAMIAASSVGVSSVALSYTGNFKTEGIIGNMCGLSDYIVTLDKSQPLQKDADNIFNKVDLALENAYENRGILKRKTSEIKENVLNSAFLLKNEESVN